MKLQRLAFVAGLGLVAWLVHRIGLATVARNLERVGWGFAAVLAIEGVSLTISTLAWRATLRAAVKIPFRSLLAMRLAGDAVNALAPVAVVGGEVIRARLLATRVPGPTAIASVALAAFAQFAAQVLYVGLGSFGISTALLPGSVRWVCAGVLVAFSILLTAVLGSTVGSSAGLAGRPAAAWLRRLAPVPADPSAGPSTARAVADALRPASGGLVWSIPLFLAGWCLTFVEVALILALLGSPVPARMAFSIAVSMVFVEGLLFFVPARAGVAEGGLYTIFGFFGLDPATGFSLAIVRRAREIVWGLIGLALLGARRPASTPACVAATELTTDG